MSSVPLGVPSTSPTLHWLILWRSNPPGSRGAVVAWVGVSCTQDLNLHHLGCRKLFENNPTSTGDLNYQYVEQWKMTWLFASEVSKAGFICGLSDVFSRWDRGCQWNWSISGCFAWLCTLKLKSKTFLREVLRISALGRHRVKEPAKLETCHMRILTIAKRTIVKTYEETGWLFFFPTNM